jgi:hypothetical protein
VQVEIKEDVDGIGGIGEQAISRIEMKFIKV